MEPYSHVRRAFRLSTGDSEKALTLLDSAVKTHMKELEAHVFGPSYLRLLNPDMLLQVVREYQRHAPDIAVNDSDSMSAPAPPALK